MWFLQLILLSCSLAWGFQVAPLVVRHPCCDRQVPIATTTTLWADDSSPSDSASSEVESDATSATEASEEEAAAEAEEEEEEEDPELKALKNEIAELETTLKDKRRTLAGTQDKADEYTKTGYARKVAEMENMRRARSMLQSSNKAGAVASTLAEFLPVYERLQELGKKYADDEFGKQYGALQTSMKQAFDALGVTEYAVAVGELVHNSRMTVLDSVHSTEQPADTVLEALRPGLELQGNVVRFAEVIASLGPEEAEEAPSDEDESKPDEPPTEEMIG